MGKAGVIPSDPIESKILEIRGEKVIIDADLAEFYGIPTRRLNEQVKRNLDRFPSDFMFQLNSGEKSELVANCDHLNKLKYSSTLPFAFTEHGAIMAANVLNSPHAVEMGVFVVRAFVNLRRTISTNQVLARKLNQLEKRLSSHDEQLAEIVRVIRSLLGPKAVPRKRRIGFESEDP